MKRHILITGASTGIGRAIALDLDRRGFVVYAGVRKQADAGSIQAEASEFLVPVTLDVTDQQGIQAAFADIQDRCGDDGLWGLVNNAGVVVSGPLEYLPIDDLRWQMEVNVVGQIAVTQTFMPLIRKAGGRIVFTGSSNGYFSPPFVGPYSASKHAIEAISDALRRELRPWGIEVILVQPGAIKTPIWDTSRTKADEIIENLPPDAIELYGQAIESVTATVDKHIDSAAPVQTVSDIVHTALTAPKPKTRYKVGLDASGQAFLKWFFPDRTVDKLLSKVFGH